MLVSTIESIYNPNQLTRYELIDRFVVRQRIFERLYRHISDAKMNIPEEHLLIIGQRGMGKTTLLLRLAYEVEKDENLQSWLIPVVFREEQYSIRKLFNLWEETAHLLADKDTVFKNLFDEMDALYTTNDTDAEERYEKLAFNLLIKKLQKQQKKIILCIDNFQDLLKKLSKQESQRLRKILTTCTDIRIIAASPVAIDALHDYKYPLYEHFKTFHLKGLNEEQTIRLIKKLGESYKPKEVADLIQNQRSRIETIRRITGGVIRTMILLFEIFVDNRKGDVFRDLERLLDRVTPLYKDRTDDLPKNQQVIIDAIALAWDATSTKDIKKRTRLESKVVSAQLAQLAKNDWIEVIPTSTKNHLYRLKERFYNIWYLMRNGRKKDTQRVLWLVRFLEDWLDENGTNAKIKQLIKYFEKGEYDEKGAFYMTEALIQTSHINAEKEVELLNAAKSFLEGKKSELADKLSLSNADIAMAIIQHIYDEEIEEALDLLPTMRLANISTYCFFAILLGKKYHDIKKKNIEIIQSKLYTKKIAQSSTEFQIAILILLAMGEYDFLQKYFNSDFAKEQGLKERYKSHWYALTSFLQKEVPDEYLKMGPELYQTVNEIIEGVNMAKNMYLIEDDLAAKLVAFSLFFPIYVNRPSPAAQHFP